METTSAIASNSPIKTPNSASANVKMSAFRGSLVSPYPLPNILGMILSLAMACIIRGAPNIPPKADERVAPQIPAITGHDQNAILLMKFTSLINVSRLTK